MRAAAQPVSGVPGVESVGSEQMFRWLKKLWEMGAPKPMPSMPDEPDAADEPTPIRSPDHPSMRTTRSLDPPEEAAPLAPKPAARERPAAAPRPARTRRDPQGDPPAEGRSGRDAPGRSTGSSWDWRSYDEVAEDYERVYAPYTTEPVRDLLTLAEAAPGLRVLDVGTGTAHAVSLTQEAVGEAGLAIGVDPAARMLEIAHGRHPELRLAAAEVVDLPFRVETFDVVLANFALPYFRKLDTALFDMRRVLRPGGRIAVSVWGSFEDDLTRTWRLLCEEAVGRDVLRAGLKDEMPWAEKLGDPKRLESSIRDRGFRPVRVEKRKYRFEIDREDYIVAHEIEATGRYVRKMLGPQLWERFRERVRARYAESFPERLLDFRDVMLAVGTKPA